MRERLIGAIVLVVIAVILIPWLVSRAHHPREQVHMLPLPVAATVNAPSVLPLPAVNKPLPDATTTSAARTASSAMTSPVVATVHAAAATTKPAIKKPAAADSASKSAANAGNWYVQVASFTARDGAQKLAAKLSKAGFHAYISAHPVKKRTWYRVRVGPYRDRAAARKAAVGIAKLSRTKVLVRESDGRDG